MFQIAQLVSRGQSPWGRVSCQPQIFHPPELRGSQRNSEQGAGTQDRRLPAAERSDRMAGLRRLAVNPHLPLSLGWFLRRRVTRQLVLRQRCQETQFSGATGDQLNTSAIRRPNTLTGGYRTNWTSQRASVPRGVESRGISGFQLIEGSAFVCPRTRRRGSIPPAQTAMPPWIQARGRTGRSPHRR